jgi:hypothetical protein
MHWLYPLLIAQSVIVGRRKRHSGQGDKRALWVGGSSDGFYSAGPRCANGDSAIGARKKQQCGRPIMGMIAA